MTSSSRCSASIRSRCCCSSASSGARSGTSSRRGDGAGRRPGSMSRSSHCSRSSPPLPAILVAVVASVTLDRGLDQLFSTRTRSMMENSLIVADAYVREHAQSIRADADAMAIDVARAKPMFEQDRDRFRQFFTAQASLRDLPTAMMITGGPDRHPPGRYPAAPGVAAAGGAAAGDAGQGGGGHAPGRVPERGELRGRGDQAARL